MLITSLGWRVAALADASVARAVSSNAKYVTDRGVVVFCLGFFAADGSCLRFCV